METWDPFERKVEAIAEMTWKLSQNSDTNAKEFITRPVQLVHLAKEQGWSKDIEAMDGKGVGGTEVNCG